MGMMHQIDALDETIKSIKGMFRWPRKSQFGGLSIYQPVCVSLKMEEWERFLTKLEWLKKHEDIISALR